jgi:pimeloyl-ACP methyl ester carboxylesterase
MDDFALDVTGLLDHLDLQDAHLVGASMGGMIAQLVAGKFPERVRSLTSIMSSSGSNELPWGDVEAYFSTIPEVEAPRNDHIEYGIQYRRFDGGNNPDTFDEEYVRFRIAKDYDRSHHHGNETRQLLAVLAAGDRLDLLPTITAPTLVLHGDRDPSLPLVHGEHTHQLIPGSSMVVIPGMGHSIEPAQVPQILGPIVDHISAIETLRVSSR